jgi:transcriptional regulator with XRE-family HTH domain
MDAKTFWGNVNPLIKSRKTTQRAVSEEIGISLGTFQGWVARDTLPDAVSALKIAQALGTTVEYLVTGKSPEPSAADQAITKIEDVISQYRKK